MSSSKPEPAKITLPLPVGTILVFDHVVGRVYLADQSLRGPR